MSCRKEVLRTFNSTSSRFAENISVYYALDLNESLGISYFELNRASNELGEYFMRIFGENKYIGVSLSDYFLLPCLILGIWKSGNCFAGVGTQYTKENIIEFLKFLRVKYLITDKNKNEYGGNLISQFIIHNRIFYIWFHQTEEDFRCLQDFSYAIMTSGTTGDPKIIQVPWSCILPNAIELSSEFQVTELDCIFQASPYSFDPFFIELLLTFLNGSSLIIVPDFIKLNPSNLLKTLFENSRNKSSLAISSSVESENLFHLDVKKVVKKNVTILQMTPSVFQRWSNNEIKNVILSSNTQLRVLILGGEKFPNEVLKLRHPLNRTRIFNIYGITEISCWAFLNEITSTETSSTEISLGKPLKNVLYKISKNGTFEIGSQERICLVNNEKTVDFPLPVYRQTGDIVEILNEKIYYKGRSDQIVKKFGMKINLSKIEDCFLRENKLIKECFCVFDKESLKLALFYVPDGVDSDDLNFERISVEEFNKMNYKIPFESIKNIEKPDYLIEMTKTPVNSHGKCNKERLLQYLKTIQTKRLKQNIEITFEKVWVEVLNREKINSSTFLELGGNSILGLNLINKLEEEGVTVPNNFITKLLGGENYDNCLECLSLAQDECGIPRKRVTFLCDEDSTDEGLIKLSLSWKFNLEKCVDATPSVFQYEGREILVVGSHSFKLYCLDSREGTETWRTQLGGRIESGFTPLNDGSKGYVGCYDHYVYCVGTKDGKIIWKFKTGSMVKSTPCLSSDEKIVYVASYDKNLYCLSSNEGKLIKTLNLSKGGIYCSGIADSSLQSFFIGTLDGSCFSISQETNDPTWKITFKNPIFAAPCLLPTKTEILFAEVVGVVHCLNTQTGEKMWDFQAEGNIYSTPTITVNDKYQYIMFGCHDGHLYCLEYDEKPALKWKQPFNSQIFAKPLIFPDSEVVCAASTKGVVCLCNLHNGSLLHQMPLQGEIFSSPIHRDNRLFVGCRDNNVYCLEISETLQ